MHISSAYIKKSEFYENNNYNIKHFQTSIPYHKIGIHKTGFHSILE